VNITVIEIGGFSQWQKVQDAEWTFKKILATDIRISALFDRYYRCEEEIAEFLDTIRLTIPDCFVLGRKEIENYLLDVDAITRAINERLKERHAAFEPKSADFVRQLLDEITEGMRSNVLAQLSANRVRFFSGRSSKDPSTIINESIEWLDRRWRSFDDRLKMVPGKDVFSSLNKKLQESLGINISSASVIRHLTPANVPEDLRNILSAFDKLASS
jgi:hypothetical protein